MTKQNDYSKLEERGSVYFNFDRLIGHLGTILLVTGILAVFMLTQLLLTGKDHNTKDIYIAYGNVIPVFLYMSLYVTLLLIPFNVVNFLGFILFSLFPQKPRLKASALFSPFICFRLVTKGTNVNLIKSNVKRNLATCESISLNNCLFEIITENDINFEKHMRIREVVVPESYITVNRSTGKARCLQYSLLEEINVLSYNDWVVHLDEETVLTDSALIGILNFINEEQYFIGQGVITYANEGVSNWFTVLSDLVRVGYDYGMLRFSLKILHRPYFSCKDTFLVSRAGIERSIAFDAGPEASTSAEAYFVMTALEKGHRFSFIEGEMWQKSAFTVAKFIQRRHFWYKGIMMLMLSKFISPRNKLGLACIVLAAMASPFMVSSFLMSPFFPLPLESPVKLLLGFIFGSMWSLYIIGAIKSFHYRRFGWPKFIFLCTCPMVILPLATILETMAFVWGVFSL